MASNVSSPITFPSPKDVKNTEVLQRDPVGSTRDDFENIGQFDDFGGAWWEWVLTIPRFGDNEIKDAKDWNGFLTALKGQEHYFKLGPQFDDGLSGAASGETDLKVKSIDSSSTVITVKNLPTSTSEVFVRGDWLSVSVSGGGEELKKVLLDTDSNGSGEADVDVWPRFRQDPSTDDAVEVKNPKGLWRLAENKTDWSWQVFTQQEIDIPIVEAVEELV